MDNTAAPNVVPVPPQEVKHNYTKIFLIILTVLFILSLPIWMVGLIFSPFAFDQGITDTGVLLVYTLFMYPVLGITTLIFLWRTKKWRWIWLMVLGILLLPGLLYAIVGQRLLP